MAFKNIKNHISNLATPFLSNAIGKLQKPSSAADAGKVAAKLLKKSPFEIDNSPVQNQIANPLSFAFVQYPLDLGSTELGHYIMFESGFVGYNSATSNFLGTKNRISNKKIQSKLPNKSFTTSSIAIYMPPNVKVSYNQTYDSEPGGIFASAEVLKDAVQTADDTNKKILEALKGGTGLAVQKAKQVLGEFISLAGQGDPIKVGLKRKGLAANPRNEQFYDSPAFREFTYEFDFWPRSAKEADAVKDIITIFKYNSSPGLNAGTLGSFFDTPNYFKIKYMYNDKVNTNLHLISACYCKSVEVDYQPDGQTTFFSPEDGSSPFPVHTKLSVGFVEDRILTKSDITDGA